MKERGREGRGTKRRNREKYGRKLRDVSTVTRCGAYLKSDSEKETIKKIDPQGKITFFKKAD